MARYGMTQTGSTVHVISRDEITQFNERFEIAFCGLAFRKTPWLDGKQDRLKDVDVHPADQIGICRNCLSGFTRAEDQLKINESFDVRRLGEA